MSIKLRIATFNLENFDDKPGGKPTLSERIAVMRPQLIRANADILCLQEINAQNVNASPRRLLALEHLLEGTAYASYHQVSSVIKENKQLYPERNLVILSCYAITEPSQYLQDLIKTPRYQLVTAIPEQTEAKRVEWERPIVYAKISVPGNRVIHVINLHLKSKIPTTLPGQMQDPYTWRTPSSWAEGFFLSSIKRVGQALEARILIDKIFDQDENAMLVVCGDFNADSDEVPVEAIRGDVENTGNGALAKRVLVPCERTIPEPARFSLLHQGKGKMLDHLLVSRALLAYYKGAEIHNELLHDESLAFAEDTKYPESDHAPVIATFELPAG